MGVDKLKSGKAISSEHFSYYFVPNGAPPKYMTQEFQIGPSWYVNPISGPPWYWFSRLSLKRVGYGACVMNPESLKPTKLMKRPIPHAPASRICLGTIFRNQKRRPVTQIKKKTTPSRKVHANACSKGIWVPKHTLVVLVVHEEGAEVSKTENAAGLVMSPVHSQGTREQIWSSPLRVEWAPHGVKGISTLFTK